MEKSFIQVVHSFIHTFIMYLRELAVQQPRDAPLLLLVLPLSYIICLLKEVQFGVWMSVWIVELLIRTAPEMEEWTSRYNGSTTTDIQCSTLKLLHLHWIPRHSRQVINLQTNCSRFWAHSEILCTLIALLGQVLGWLDDRHIPIILFVSQSAGECVCVSEKDRLIASTEWFWYSPVMNI